jgi:hypothetical protein
MREKILLAVELIAAVCAIVLSVNKLLSIWKQLNNNDGFCIDREEHFS